MTIENCEICGAESNTVKKRPKIKDRMCIRCYNQELSKIDKHKILLRLPRDVNNRLIKSIEKSRLSANNFIILAIEEKLDKDK